MRILAYISKIQKRGEFFVITVRDVGRRYHTLFFNEDKWKQIKKEYDAEDLLGLPCILEDTGRGRISGFIQTNFRNDPISNDNKEVKK